jgi:hypothetical protein
MQKQFTNKLLDKYYIKHFITVLTLIKTSAITLLLLKEDIIEAILAAYISTVGEFR